MCHARDPLSGEPARPAAAPAIAGLAGHQSGALARAGADVVAPDLLVESELPEDPDPYGPLATVADIAR